MILVVEDEGVIRELLCEILETEGFVTVSMENADLALDFLNRCSGDVALLLTDVNMPGNIDGAALANASTQRWPLIPVIVMSGVETLKSSGIRGVDHFIRKPFAMDEMLFKVRTALSAELEPKL